MARVTAPLLSLDATQSVGGAMTFKHWRGYNIVNRKANPGNPQTSAQGEVRSYLAGGGKITKTVDTTGNVASELREVAPSGQSYLSFFVREILGGGNQNIQDAIAAYDGDATQAGLFDTVSDGTALESVSFTFAGAVDINPGQLLWSAMAASFRLGHSDAVDPATASQAEIETYATALTGATFA